MPKDFRSTCDDCVDLFPKYCHEHMPRGVDFSEAFGQYKVRKYTDSTNDYNVTLHFGEVALEHLQLDTAEEASNEYNLIRGIVKHAAGQIEMARGGSGFGSAGSAPQML